MLFFGEFSAADVPLSELVAFLAPPGTGDRRGNDHALGGVSGVPSSEAYLHRPFTWTTSIESLDGIISFSEQDSAGSKEVALGHKSGSGSLADFRVLNASWMFADCVLVTAENIRREHSVVCYSRFAEMEEYRTDVLRKRWRRPLQAVVTMTTDVDVDHAIFASSGSETPGCVVYTTEQGSVILSRRFVDAGYVVTDNVASISRNAESAMDANAPREQNRPPSARPAANCTSGSPQVAGSVTVGESYDIFYHNGVSEESRHPSAHVLCVD
eukprot:Opistho-2@20299